MGARSGAMVRDQVLSIVEAAGASAASIERDALARRGAILAESRAISARLYESITTMADELDDLRSVATREADTLRSLLARGGPAARDAGASTVHRLEARPLEGEAARHVGEIGAGDPTLPEPRPAELNDGDPTPPEPRPADLDDPEPAERPAIEAGEPGPPGWGENGQPEPAQPVAEGESGQPVPEPERVAVNSDEGLAENYLLAIESYALAVDRGDVDEAKLWEGLRRAAVEEARARPELGRSEPDASLSRRQRRRRDKRLRALIKARDETPATPPDA